MLKKIGGYFGLLRGNAKVCIAFHPLWGVPYTFYTYYISLYLQANGLTDSHLGALMVAGTAAAFVFSLLSAPLVDRMGRKRATLVFDLLSSAAPPLLYLFAHSFLPALVAILLFNANRIMSVAYYLVMIEDAEDETRIVAFNLFNIITVAAGLLIPVAGVFVDRFGVAATERVFLLCSFLLMTGMILFRNVLLQETSVGERVRAEARAGGGSVKGLWRGLFGPYRKAVSFLLRNRVARAFALANVFFCVYMNLGTNYSLYFVPYFSDRLGMGTMEASVLGSVYYAGMLAAMILLNPVLGRRGISGQVAASGVVTLLGLLLMILIPAGVFSLALLAVLVTAVGYGMLKSGVDGALAVYSESEFRSGVYSVANLLSAGLGIVVTALCSLLYARYPGWLYILCAVMVAAMLACVLSVRKELPKQSK